MGRIDFNGTFLNGRGCHHSKSSLLPTYGTQCYVCGKIIWSRDMPHPSMILWYTVVQVINFEYYAKKILKRITLWFEKNERLPTCVCHYLRISVSSPQILCTVTLLANCALSLCKFISGSRTPKRNKEHAGCAVIDTLDISRREFKQDRV